MAPDDEVLRRLVTERRGHIVAAAGCGKTELIAKAVRVMTTGRHLVLTHTHAGVDALRRRMHRFGIPGSAYRVETIAGWALRYARAYPGMSGFRKEMPRGDDWPEVYAAAARLVERRAIRSVITGSYSGVCVDEYQDCSKRQHELILALAELIPVRVLGDPLQGIFDFPKGDQQVDWTTDVVARFPLLGSLTTPHRWATKNPELGRWLLSARVALERGEPLNLVGAPVT